MGRSTIQPATRRTQSPRARPSASSALMVYLAPAPAVHAACSEWGGWHVTLVGQGNTDFNELMSKVQTAARQATDGPGGHGRWPWFANDQNTAVVRGSDGRARIAITNSRLVSGFCSALMQGGVLNVKKDLHMETTGIVNDSWTPNILAKMRGAVPFYLYIVERVGNDVRWSVVRDIPFHQQLEPDADSEAAAQATRAARSHFLATRYAPGPLPRPTAVSNPGAGVVLVELYRRKERPARQGIAVILFREAGGALKGQYSDAGGSVENGQSWELTAKRELLEESCGMFNIDVARASRTHVSVNNMQYTAFFVPVWCAHGIEWWHYNENYTSLRQRQQQRQQQQIPKAWRETDAMTRVFLDDFAAPLASWNSGTPLSTYDVYGKEILVSARAAAAVRHFLRIGCANNLSWNDLRYASSGPISHEYTMV